ncbi:MAG: serine hydrolase [Gammaproteobacteria bacterium]|nr:serine hydrolase [Gammaproteobacteria bacterium]
MTTVVRGLIMLACASLLIAACTSSPPLRIDQQSVDSSYKYTVPPQDDDRWPTASLDAVGIQQQPLAALVSRIKDNTFPRIYSVLVVKDGKLVFEEYFAGYHRYRLNEMHSVSKSVTAILVGMAVDQGLMNVDDQVYKFFPDYPGLEWIDRPYDITVRDLLTMSHGTDWDERSRPLSDPENSIRAMIDSDEWLRFTLSHKLVESPGERFNYAGGMTVLLGEIVHRTSGRDLGDYAQRRLFQPLDIWIKYWHRSDRGIVNAQGGLLLRPRDMAKIGQLMLDNGSWNGNRIVSEMWVRSALQRHVSAEFGWGYGYQWRLGQAPVGDQLIDMFFAAGRGGQNIIVFPTLDLVVVFTAQPKDNRGGGLRNYTMALDYVLPAVTGVMPPSPISIDPEKLKRYAGHYRHSETGHELAVAVESDRLVVQPSDWQRVAFVPVAPDSFSGYWGNVGSIRVQFSAARADKAQRITARFMFGKRIYERVADD